MHAILHTLSTITNCPHHNQSQYSLQQGNNPHIRRQPLHRIQLTLAQPSLKSPYPLWVTNIRSSWQMIATIFHIHTQISYPCLFAESYTGRIFRSKIPINSSFELPLRYNSWLAQIECKLSL